MRQSIKQQFGVPQDMFRFAGYGLFVGQKAEPGSLGGRQRQRAHT